MMTKRQYSTEVRNRIAKSFYGCETDEELVGSIHEGEFWNNLRDFLGQESNEARKDVARAVVSKRRKKSFWKKVGKQKKVVSPKRAKAKEKNLTFGNKAAALKKVALNEIRMACAFE